jgi:hypothetical protein
MNDNQPLLNHTLSCDPGMNAAALRAWARKMKAVVEQDCIAEVQSKANPQGDPWAEGARNAINFHDPLVR